MTLLTTFNSLDINESLYFDDDITEVAYYHHYPYSSCSLNYNDDIRFGIEQKNVYIYPSDSYICLKGKIKNFHAEDVSLDFNGLAYIFSEMTYNLNGIEIERVHDVGTTSGIRSILLRLQDNNIWYNQYGMQIISPAHTNPYVGTIDDKGNFSIELPLQLFFGFAYDYKKPILNARHELILKRDSNDNNVLYYLKPIAYTGQPPAANTTSAGSEKKTPTNSASGSSESSSKKPETEEEKKKKEDDETKKLEETAKKAEETAKKVEETKKALDTALGPPMVLADGTTVHTTYKRDVSMQITRKKRQLEYGESSPGWPSITLNSISWKVPYIKVNDEKRAYFLKTLKNDTAITIPFRAWTLFEHPGLPETNDVTWNIKMTNNNEKLLYLVVAFQTNKKNDISVTRYNYDHLNVKNMKVYLNAQYTPYEAQNADFTTNDICPFYEEFIKFEPTYNKNIRTHVMPNPIISKHWFNTIFPIFVMNLSYRDTQIKNGISELKLQFQTNKNIPAKTTCYAILVYETAYRYKPFSETVQRIF